MGRYKKLLSNTAILAVGTFASKVLVFLMMPLYTSILATDEFSVADLITQTANLLIPLACIGIIDGFFRFALDGEDEKPDPILKYRLLCDLEQACKALSDYETAYNASVQKSELYSELTR